MDSEHIKTGVCRLFEFMERENIAHSSKVSKSIRFDSVVVRVSNENDAKKIGSFIFVNDFFRDALISPNPFAHSKDNVAYACDAFGSYNELVANTIMYYIRSRINSNETDKISINDFVFYSISKYNECIVEDKLDEWMNELNLSYPGAKGYETQNFSQVMRLFLTSMNPEYTHNDFLTHFRNNIAIYKKCMSVFKKEDYFELKKEILEKNVTGTFDKHGERHVVLALSQFLRTGSFNGFTRYGIDGERLRDNLINNVSKEDAALIIGKCLDLPEDVIHDKGMYLSMSTQYCRIKIQEYLSNREVSSEFTDYGTK